MRDTRTHVCTEIRLNDISESCSLARIGCDTNVPLYHVAGWVLQWRAAAIFAHRTDHRRATPRPPRVPSLRKCGSFMARTLQFLQVSRARNQREQQTNGDS